MTLAALLTFFSILLAVLALARPVRRKSLELFASWWHLIGALLVSFIFLVCRDAPLGVSPPFGWPLPNVVFCLTVGAFIVPVLAAVWSWLSWRQAKLTRTRIKFVESIFHAALREREFDEVERIVRKNQKRLTELPASAASALFSPPMVAALVESHSLVHLELLSNMDFLRSLENRFGAVDVVVRELLRADVSPIRSAVVSKYGGLEHQSYSDPERGLMEKTFQDPTWYSETRADYPLVISAIEALRGGKLDSDYNDIGRDYEATQGMSKRSRCPIYLAVKTHVLAIQSAIEKGVERDFYISDFFDIFRAIQERSKFDKAVWEDRRANREFPTPYAFLLYTIAADIEELSSEAVEAACRLPHTHHIEIQGRVAPDLARNWSFCVWSIAESQQQVAPEFRNDIIREYLAFILKLGWAPSEICFGHEGSDEESLAAWRDLFLKELRERFMHGGPTRREAIKNAAESLDKGKRYYEGYSWLEKQLFSGD